MKLLTSEQAFEAMRLFLEIYYRQTNSDDVAVILTDTKRLPDGMTIDPAAWHDWIECVAKASAQSA